MEILLSPHREYNLLANVISFIDIESAAADGWYGWSDRRLLAISRKVLSPSVISDVENREAVNALSSFYVRDVLNAALKSTFYYIKSLPWRFSVSHEGSRGCSLVVFRKDSSSVLPVLGIDILLNKNTAIWGRYSRIMRLPVAILGMKEHVRIVIRGHHKMTFREFIENVRVFQIISGQYSPDNPFLMMDEFSSYHIQSILIGRLIRSIGTAEENLGIRKDLRDLLQEFEASLSSLYGILSNNMSSSYDLRSRPVLVEW